MTRNFTIAVIWLGVGLASAPLTASGSGVESTASETPVVRAAGPAGSSIGSTAAPDDPDAQEEVDEGKAELEAVRHAEEKAFLVPAKTGQGALDGLAHGLSAWNPLLRDVQAALGTSVAGAPLGDPLGDFGSGEISLSLAELTGISPAELKAKYDIPVELNEQVVAYLRFFQTDARPHFERWLARSSKWLPSMRAILEREGVPLDLVYLSMIESGFNAYAYSPAKASGLWQFIVGTSRRYGLTTDFWIDERRDPLLATVAAAHYLLDLKTRFHGDWYLAWAGYNAGEGKIEKAIRRDATVDFWRMSRKGRTLRAETRHYVPKLIAAAIIAKHPERFGFRVTYEPAFAFDEAIVSEATDLYMLAKAAGTEVETLRLLNPALRRFCTPPGSFALRLPPGTKGAFTLAYDALGKGERLTFAQHTLERGESLGKIALAYGVTQAAILKTNGLKSVKQVRRKALLVIPLGASRGLVAGATLDKSKTYGPLGRTITAQPSKNYADVRTARDRALAEGRPDPAEDAARRAEVARLAAAKQAAERRTRQAQARANHATPHSATSSSGLYVVQPGDSLWTIASKLGTTVEELARINRLSKRKARSLMPGQSIVTRAS